MGTLLDGPPGERGPRESPVRDPIDFSVFVVAQCRSVYGGSFLAGNGYCEKWKGRVELGDSD